MTDDLKWIVGAGVTVALAMVTHTIAALRSVRNKQSDDMREVHKKLDNVKNEFASKSEVKIMTDHIDQRITDMREDSQRRHDELKDFIRTHLSSKN